MRAVIVMSLLALTLAACASETSVEPTVTVDGSPSASASSSPTPTAGAVPEGAVTVIRTAECQTVEPGSPQDLGDGGYAVTVSFTCDSTAADERAVGVETFTLVARVTDPTVGGLCTVEDALLVTERGTWRGGGDCVVDQAGMLVPALYVEPWYFGRIEYAGEAGLAGLRYVAYFSGSQGRIVHAGWVADAG